MKLRGPSIAAFLQQAEANLALLSAQLQDGRLAGTASGHRRVRRCVARSSPENSEEEIDDSEVRDQLSVQARTILSLERRLKVVEQRAWTAPAASAAVAQAGSEMLWQEDLRKAAETISKDLGRDLQRRLDLAEQRLRSYCDEQLAALREAGVVPKESNVFESVVEKADKASQEVLPNAEPRGMPEVQLVKVPAGPTSVGFQDPAALRSSPRNQMSPSKASSPGGASDGRLNMPLFMPEGPASHRSGSPASSLYRRRDSSEFVLESRVPSSRSCPPEEGHGRPPVLPQQVEDSEVEAIASTELEGRVAPDHRRESVPLSNDTKRLEVEVETPQEVAKPQVQSPFVPPSPEESDEGPDSSDEELCAELAEATPAVTAAFAAPDVETPQEQPEEKERDASDEKQDGQEEGQNHQKEVCNELEVKEEDTLAPKGDDEDCWDEVLHILAADSEVEATESPQLEGRVDLDHRRESNDTERLEVEVETPQEVAKPQAQSPFVPPASPEESDEGPDSSDEELCAELAEATPAVTPPAVTAAFASLPNVETPQEQPEEKERDESDEKQDGQEEGQNHQKEACNELEVKEEDTLAPKEDDEDCWDDVLHSLAAEAPEAPAAPLPGAPAAPSRAQPGTDSSSEYESSEYESYEEDSEEDEAAEGREAEMVVANMDSTDSESVARATRPIDTE